MKNKISYFLILVMLLMSFNNVSAADYNNIALGKRYKASTQYSSSYPPGNAFDGNLNTFFSAGSEVLDGKIDDAYNFIMVDLGGTYEISSINVRSRRDMDQPNSRRDWTIQGSLDSSFTSPAVLGVKTASGAFGSDLEVTLPEGNVYRYIRVISTYTMVISEFEVYGRLVDMSETYSDIGEELYHENMMNSYLNLVKPLKSTEFAVKSLLTYEAASEIILRCLNEYEENDSYMEECIEKGICYTDISKKEKYIKTADFAAMAIRALGFGELLDNKSPDENGIKTFANRIGLCENVVWKNGSYLSRENALRFAYNMMIIKTCEPESISASEVVYAQNGKTLLEKKFGLIYREGQVTANSVTTLHEARNSDRVVINGKSYYDKCGKTEALIGRNVRFIADTDNNIVSVWEDFKELTSVRINAHDIAMSTLKDISVENEEGKTVKYRFDNVYSVIKNGVAFNDYTSQTFIPQNGEIELIDSDRNGRYDIINVWHPEVVICTGMSVTDRKIALAKNDGTSLVYDKFEVCVTEINGINVAPEDFSLCKLLYVYPSENGEYVRIAGSTSIVSGTITEISDNEKITIDEEEYIVSGYCLNDSESMTRIKLGNFCTALTDDNGYIVWIERNENLREEETLGYLIKTGTESGISSKVQFKIFRRDGVIAIYESADSIRVDGEKYKNSKLANEIRENSSFRNAIEEGFVVFTLNNLGQISEIDTERETSKDSPYSKVKKITDASGFYLTGNMLAVGNKMLMPFEGKTPMFIIPTDKSLDEKYNVYSASSRFTSGYEETALCSFYGADEWGYPYFCAVNVSYSGLAAGVGIINNSSVNFAVVEKVRVKDNDGDETYAITGYNLSNGSIINFTTDDEAETMIDKRTLAMEKSSWINSYGGVEGYNADIRNYFLNTAELKEGDIIAYRQSNNKLYAVERVFAADSDERNINYIHRHGEYYSSRPLFCDKVMLFGEYVLYDSINKKIKIYVGNNEYVYGTEYLGGLYYGKGGKDFEKITMDEFFECVTDSTRIMIYTERGVAKGIYIL